MRDITERSWIIMDGIDTTPLLTIIVPSYNQAKLLPKLLDSLLNQTRKDFRVIVGDDFSTDNTDEVLRDYFPKFKEAGIKFMTIRRLQNLGVQEHAKSLLAEVDTKYVALLEGDDWAFPERVETQLEFLEANPDWGAHHSDIEMVYENGVVTYGYWNLCGGYPIQSPMTFIWLLQNNRIFVCSLMARTELFKKAFDYDVLIEKGIKLGDYYACLHLTKLTKIGYTDKVLAGYLNRHDSASHSMTREELLSETYKAQQAARDDFGALERQWT